MVKSLYRDSSPNEVSSNTDFGPSKFWFREKKFPYHGYIQSLYYIKVTSHTGVFYNGKKSAK